MRDDDITATARALTRAALHEHGSVCIVNDRDYHEHFEGKGAIEPPKWNGKDRRRRVRDRRASKHDRRWDAERGRRMRLSDRRDSQRRFKSQQQNAISAKK